MYLVLNITKSDRGVKVELGIPYDLWDTPSAEITNLKKYVNFIIINSFAMKNNYFEILVR